MNQSLNSRLCLVLATGLAVCCCAAFANEPLPATSQDRSKDIGSIEATNLRVAVYADGSYSIAAAGITRPVLRSDVEAVVDALVLRSTAYPRHDVVKSEQTDGLGAGPLLTVTHTGLAGRPDLVSTFRLMRDQSWGEMAVEVRNATGQAISVQSIRSVHASAAPVVDLHGPAFSDRILSDSYSEDRPQLAIRDLGDTPKGLPGLHRAVGTQLIYNPRSGESLFLGALSSDRLLTIFHLREKGSGSRALLSSFDVEATGTTEILKGESLKDSAPAEQVNLSLRVASGESLSSERLMFAVGNDYHQQLEQYGRAVGLLHKARIGAPTPIGWWSWTAYYFGLNEGTAGTNALWLAENLKPLGYDYFHIDEGYQYARGEYTTADAKLFPRGLGYTADLVRQAGLTFGVWTAPFEVSERAWVFQNHPDWLLHNAAGELIHIGYVTEKNDPLYVLDATNPGAQDYLRRTYRSLRDWGVRFIKMDFMDDTAVEGSYFRANTTALEAQRIGLKIIREAVGDSVVLDKDGSPILNPVGIVDAGRISQDTGHSFEASRDAASGIAARYYINRNFFIADPDAFTVSTQTVDDQSWHGGQRPLSLDEAKVSIALAAVSGGMFEIGDDLPTLGASPERLSLVKNSDLIEMARLGRASTPVDLMSYAPSDLQPSVFLLKENERQSILTIFNWTDRAREHAINFAQLGLKAPGNYTISELFGDPGCCSGSSNAQSWTQKPHSVRMLKLIDESVAAIPPPFEVLAASGAAAGASMRFEAAAESAQAPVLSCRWDFGDGSSEEGIEVQHAFTHAGNYEVQATVSGLDAAVNRRTVSVSISGEVSTRFVPSEKQRAERPDSH
ncbi:MAG TPA: alpha-galactosidase [Steroidobacteraceae bacterium]|nr:alpha-galactosidase [Steroidobacteraceae bacterium]